MKSKWEYIPFCDAIEIWDTLRKPINSKERSARIEGKAEFELYPYYGATGQVGLIDDYITDGEYVLLGEDGAPFLNTFAQKAYLINGKTWVNNHAHVLRSKTNNRFLCYYLNYSEKDKIRNMTSIVTSGSRGWAKYYADEGARFIRITDLTRDKITLKNDSIQRVNLPENAEGKRSKLKENDVLVSITADLGSIALIPKGMEEAYINQHIAMIRFSNSNQGEFMAWYLKSDFGQKDLLKNKRGGGKLGLGLDDIRDTPVPVVSGSVAMEVVNNIDSKLSVCDSIEQTIDFALQQAEALRQSILKKAFEGEI